MMEFDRTSQVIAINQKPQRPGSDRAVAGLYFYDEDIRDMTTPAKPSARREFEIDDAVNSVRTLETGQNFRICRPEEATFEKRFILAEQSEASGIRLCKNRYGRDLKGLAEAPSLPESLE